MIEFKNKPFKNCKSISLPGMHPLYYKPEKADIMGVSLDIKPCTYDIMNRYFISDGKNIYGYYSGLNALNAIHGTTQVPAVIEIVSTKVDKNIRYKIDRMSYEIKVQPFDIDQDDYKYVQILDVVEQCYNYFEEDVHDCIKQAIQRQQLNRNGFNRYVQNYSQRTQEVIKHAFA